MEPEIKSESSIKISMDSVFACEAINIEVNKSQNDTTQRTRYYSISSGQACFLRNHHQVQISMSEKKQLWLWFAQYYFDFLLSRLGISC